MEIVKLLKDYSKNENERNLASLLSDKLVTGICVEKIKNKDFMVQYLKPINDIIITTNLYPCADFRRVNC